MSGISLIDVIYSGDQINKKASIVNAVSARFNVAKFQIFKHASPTGNPIYKSVIQGCDARVRIQHRDFFNLKKKKQNRDIWYLEASMQPQINEN